MLASSLRLPFAASLVALACAGGAAGCAGQQHPALQVVAVENSAQNPILLVQVTNPERRSIRLQRLAYTFAGSGHTSRGEVHLSRDVAAGSAVIVEVPVQLQGQGPFMLEGNLTALMDRIERNYSVHAAVPGQDVQQP